MKVKYPKKEYHYVSVLLRGAPDGLTSSINEYANEGYRLKGITQLQDTGEPMPVFLAVFEKRVRMPKPE